MTRLILVCLLLLPTHLLAEGSGALLPALPEAEARKWPAIGRVVDPGNLGRGFCSGALVAPNIVLTAGHCARANTPDEPERQLQFLAGALNDTVAARRRVIEQVPHPAYFATGRHTPDYDVGLWILDAPITDITPLPLGIAASDTFALLGYHRLIPYRLSGRKDCPLRGQSRTQLTLGCRVITGNSGSPILQIGPAGIEVVAVTSSQDGADAIAAPIGPWVHEVIHARAAQ
ncbi:MAG: trypsin-like serine protease [Pseudomonadota bacterium]